MRSRIVLAEARFRKVCVIHEILRSRILRVLYGLAQEAQSAYEEDNI